MAVIFLLNPNPKVAKTESLGAGRVPYREVYSLSVVFWAGVLDITRL
jgi:hypothetical protein